MKVHVFTKLRHQWQDMRASFWFVPAVIVVGAVGLAAGLIAIDSTFELPVVKRWPLMFGAGADGSRGLLTAVASSMITVAGVVFSITIVALSLTSSQYTSRVLRNFMRDRNNQVVLGVFVGIFAYCLVVLRVIRGGDEGAFVPSLAVLGGMVLAFVGIGFLIFFIHHISISIQASSIIAAAAHETLSAVDRLFPEGLGKGVDEAADDPLIEPPPNGVWVAVPSRKTGYIESIDGEMLLIFADERKVVLRMERGIGEFIVEGTPLISYTGLDALDEDSRKKLNTIYVISRHRSVEQDAGFGIRQIVDIALKALSPGINDTTTAVMCVDYLEAILVRIAERRIATPRRLDNGELRLIARGPSFESLFGEALNQIRQNAAGNVAILTRLLQAIETIAGQSVSARQRQVLRHHVDLVASMSERTIASPHDQVGINSVRGRLSLLLQRA